MRIKAKDNSEAGANARQSNFELLRIISMILIVAHHLAVHGEYEALSPLSSAVVKLFEVGGKIGVNVFVLISGYFLVDSKFDLKKLLKLMSEILFYSVLIYSLLAIFRLTPFSIRDFVYSLFPVSSNGYWFATTYIIMYCLFPFLNLIVKNCDKRAFAALIGFLLFLQCIINYVFKSINISDVGWFLTLYLLSAYFKLHPFKIIQSNKFMIPTAVISYLIMALFNIFTEKDYWLMTHIVCLICSVSLFNTFKNIKIKFGKFINTIAKTTFGIYLIHDNIRIRHILWVNLLKCPMHAQLKLFPLFACMAVFAVFVICALIDLIREYMFSLAGRILSKFKKPKKEDYLY